VPRAIPFIAQDRPSRSCSSPQPQCSLAHERAGGRQGKVSAGGATRCANLVHGGRRRRGRGALRSPAIAPGRRAQKWHLLRTTRRCQMKTTKLKSKCFSRKKIALMGFARNERIPPFDKKPLGISDAYSGVRMEITPRIANPSRTRMPMRVSNQVCDGNASA